MGQTSELGTRPQHVSLNITFTRDVNHIPVLNTLPTLPTRPLIDLHFYMYSIFASRE